MPVTDNRVLPLASVHIYAPGAGDPVSTDPGVWWWDVLRHSYRFGTVSLDTAGRPKLRYIEGLGLTCQERLVWQDTTTTHWTTTGGLWEARKPADGGNTRTTRLVQYQTAANTAWSAHSTFRAPHTPAFAFSVLMGATPPDNDEANYPTYCRLEFGSGSARYAISWNRDGGWALLRDPGDGGLDWNEVVSLPEPASDAWGEVLWYVRVARGRIWVSGDRGWSWESYANPDGSAIFVPSATMTWRGQGMACAFGLHQLSFAAGVYTSPPRETQWYRTLRTCTVTPFGNAPGNSSYTGADGSPAIGSTVAYTLTLTPALAAAVPWNWYHVPDVQAAYLKVMPTRAATVGSYTTPFDSALLSLDIEEPIELSEGTASWTVWHDFLTQFSGVYGAQKVQILAGHLRDDDSEEWNTLFTGYIVEPGARAERWGEKVLSFTAHNLAWRLKGDRFDDLRGTPVLSGMTVNAALDELLAYNGLDTTYRSWHPDGDAIAFGVGDYEDPALWPKVGDSVWDWMERLAAYAGLEIGVTRDGGFVTLPIDYVADTVSYTWYADPASDATTRIRSARYVQKVSEGRTMVEARGYGPNGELLVAALVDADAEVNTASDRYIGFRRAEVECVSGVVTAAMLGRIAQALARDRLVPKFEADLTVPVNPGVTRRARVQVDGTTVGIADTAEFVVREMRHHWEADPSGEGLVTTAGLQRLLA